MSDLLQKLISQAKEAATNKANTIFNQFPDEIIKSLDSIEQDFHNSQQSLTALLGLLDGSNHIIVDDLKRNVIKRQDTEKCHFIMKVEQIVKERLKLTYKTEYQYDAERQIPKNPNFVYTWKNIILTIYQINNLDLNEETRAGFQKFFAYNKPRKIGKNVIAFQRMVYLQDGPWSKGRLSYQGGGHMMQFFDSINFFQNGMVTSRTASQEKYLETAEKRYVGDFEFTEPDSVIKSMKIYQNLRLDLVFENEKLRDSFYEFYQFGR